MSAKNILQEYCQQNNLPLPTYSIISYENNLWTCNVLLHDGRTFIGRDEKKVYAEQNAAMNAHDALVFDSTPTQGSDAEITHDQGLILFNPKTFNLLKTQVLDKIEKLNPTEKDLDILVKVIGFFF